MTLKRIQEWFEWSGYVFACWKDETKSFYGTSGRYGELQLAKKIVSRVHEQYGGHELLDIKSRLRAVLEKMESDGKTKE